MSTPTATQADISSHPVVAEINCGKTGEYTLLVRHYEGKVRLGGGQYGSFLTFPANRYAIFLKSNIDGGVATFLKLYGANNLDAIRKDGTLALTVATMATHDCLQLLGMNIVDTLKQGGAITSDDVTELKTSLMAAIDKHNQEHPIERELAGSEVSKAQVRA